MKFESKNLLVKGKVLKDMANQPTLGYTKEGATLSVEEVITIRGLKNRCGLSTITLTKYFPPFPCYDKQLDVRQVIPLC